MVASSNEPKIRNRLDVRYIALVLLPLSINNSDQIVIAYMHLVTPQIANKRYYQLCSIVDLFTMAILQPQPID